jgi:hypothetical protein
MSGRLTEAGLEPAEGNAAAAIARLASEIEDLCYNHDGQNIERKTLEECRRAYRVLRRATIFYKGDEHGLVWEPPSGKFQPKEEGNVSDVHA